MEFVLYLLLGACAGVLAGLFGVGGGIIIVPVLVFSFTLQGFDASVLTHLAGRYSLATIVFTSSTPCSSTIARARCNGRSSPG
jgi:Sulfite exporter TauE/SafE.